ncbi:phosphatase PAP2 family protein [Candidatus Micrarchaeota archaeon]|nr:phosphatase PAP2 family protein [Candidatus Micrarchaeota archaeon]
MLELLLDYMSIFLHSDVYWPVFAVLFSTIVLIYTRDKKIYALALMLIVVSVPLVKDIFAEARPCESIPGRVDCPLDNGFPSQHTAIATTWLLAVIGSKAFKPYLLLFLAIAFSRIWLGVHSIDQVIGGVAFASLLYFLVFDVKNRFDKSDFGFIRKHQGLQHGFVFEE